jgi:hypothetical protein
MNAELEDLLTGGDLRSIAGSDHIVELVESQKAFDELFSFMLAEDRLQAMRASDAAEKVTRYHPEYLESHYKELLDLLKSANHKEQKWHLVPMVSRLQLNESDRQEVIETCRRWLNDPSESVIVRVNALQAMFDLGVGEGELLSVDDKTPPALIARLKKLSRD